MNKFFQRIVILAISAFGLYCLSITAQGALMLHNGVPDTVKFSMIFGTLISTIIAIAAFCLVFYIAKNDCFVIINENPAQTPAE